MRKAGRAGADKAYQAALAALTESRDLLSTQHERINSLNKPLPDDAAPALHELVETYGALGGIQQRLGLLEEAFGSYSSGAELEERFNLPGV